MTEVNVVYSIARSFDIYPNRVGHQRIHHQQYIYFSAPDEATRYGHVYLIQPDKVNLGAGKADFRIRAPNCGDDRSERTVMANPGPEQHKINLISLRAEVERARDESVLRRIELRDWFIALRAIGFHSQRNSRRHTLPAGIGCKQTRRDRIDESHPDGDCAVSARDGHRSCARRRSRRNLVIDLRRGNEEEWGETFNARAVLDLDSCPGE